MEIRGVRYSVEYYARTIWDKYYSDRRPFDTEAEAIAFIQKLSENSRVGKVYLTTIQEFDFNK